METEGIVAIVDRHAGARGALMSILEDIQAQHGYLPAEALTAVADRTGRSLVEVYGVASFYRYFRLEPRGEHMCSVCLGTACHVRGAPAVREALERHLDAKAGETTRDGEFTLETVNCLGACAIGPIVVVDGRYFSGVHAAKVSDIIAKVRAGLDKVDVKNDERIFPVAVHCSRCNHSLMDANSFVDDLPAVRLSLSAGGRHGRVWLSSLYGSPSVAVEWDVPAGAVADFHCPHCHGSLRGASPCPDCGAPMVPMLVRPAGVMQFCSRRGCQYRRLDLDGIDI